MYAAAVNVYTPVSAGSVASATAASTFKSVSANSRVWLKATVDTRVRFATSSSGSVTAGDIYLTAGTDYVFDVRGEITGFKCMKTSAASVGTLHFATVG